jgi:zinc protease
MKLQKLFFLALMCLFLTTAKRTTAQILPSDPDVTVGKLPNGFTYYVRKNTTPRKRVTLYLVNKVGSILETDEQRGLAHFMEHMTFDGTTHYPGGTLIDFLEKAGVRFGADLNAYTSYDETVYQLPLPLDKPEMLGSGLQVIRDWASEATLDQAEIDKERGVVLEEKRLRDGAQLRLQQQTFPLMVNHSKYADRLPIGTEDVLKNFKREALLNFYKDWYRPDLQAIIVVGDVDVKDVVQRIQKLFSDLHPPVTVKPRPDYQIELTGKNQFLAITDRDVQGTSMQVIMKFPHKPLSTNLNYLDFLKRNLFNMMMARHFQIVSQQNAGNYLSAGASIGSLISNVDAFSASISARPGEMEKGFGAFWKEITKIKTQGFTEDELTAVKSAYLSSVQNALSEKDKKQSAQYVQEYVRNFLHDEAFPGIEKEAELTEAYLPTISVAHINRMAKQYITDVNRDVFIIAPESQKANLPDEQQVNSWFAKYGNAVTGTEQGSQKANAIAKQPLLSQSPIAGKILSSNKIKDLGITEIKLSNGVKVILKPTTFQNDAVSFTAFSPGGTSIYPDKDYQSANYAASLTSEGGVGDFKESELEEKLYGKQVQVRPYIGERVEGISGNCTYGELETALQLTYLYFTQPRKDTSAFNATMSRTRAMLSNPVNTPEKVFADTLSGVLSNHNIRRKPQSLGDLDNITLDRSFDIYQERFKDASDFTFVFVGKFDIEKITPLLERYLGGLPATGRKEQARDLGIHIPPGKIQKTVYAGTEDKATVDLVVSGDYTYSQESAVQLQAIQYILQLRMIERLREKESGVYSPGVSMNQGRVPMSRYSFGISFGCAPANVEKLITAAWEEITKIKNNGPLPEDLEKFKAERKVGMKNALETNNFWLSYLTGQYEDQYDPKEVLNYSHVLDALTTDQLKRAFNNYLSDKNYVRAVLLPEKKSVK